MRPLDGVCEHGGVLRCCDVDSPQFLQKEIACVDRKTQTIFGAANVVGGWEEGAEGVEEVGRSAAVDKELGT